MDAGKQNKTTATTLPDMSLVRIKRHKEQWVTNDFRKVKGT